MGNTQTVGRKHHHIYKSHHTYTKKQGRHTKSKVRHTKGRRRHRYYQRGGVGEGEAAAAPAPAAAAPEPAKCPPGCKPDTAFSVDAITGNVAAKIQGFEETLKKTQNETIENAKAGFDAKKTEAAVGLTNFIKKVVPAAAEPAAAEPAAAEPAAAAAGGGKRKRKTNKRRKHSKA